MSLRTTLIIIGVAIVLAVWAVTAVRRRREARAAYRRSFSRLDIPDVILQHEEEGPEDAAEGSGYAPRLPEEVVLPGAGPAAPTDGARADPPPGPAGRADPDALPAVRNDLRDPPPVAGDARAAASARPRSDQLDLFGAPEPGATPAAAPADPPPRARDAAPPPPATPPDGLIALYLLTDDKTEIRGPELVRALNAVGMRFGEMDIFHHHGPGDLNSETPVFSAANMFEPGTFDLGRIEAFRTTGLVLFLQLPGPLDGPVAFELLLNSAQRLSELTGMTLCGDPRTQLDADAIARLRTHAAHFGDGRA